MSADNVSYQMRIKCEKTKFDEVRDTLIKDLIEVGLRPDESFDSDVVKGWQTLFTKEKNYLELDIWNCYGNWGYTLDYIKNDFVKKFPDIMFEFIVIVDDPGYRSGDQITYDGQKVTHIEAGESYGFDSEVFCPKCNGELSHGYDEFYCTECDEYFLSEEVGLDGYELFTKPMVEFDEQIGFKLIK